MSNQSMAVLDALQADLEALKNAIDAEDHATAQAIVNNHDHRLREYLNEHGAGAAPQALASLLQSQQEITARMTQLRDEAMASLRAERQSNRAASAYLTAGTLA